MTPEERAKLYGVFEEIRMLTSFLLSEYEQVSNDVELRKKIPFISAAYLQSIIINLGKIFSESKNESFRLERFKELHYPSVTARVDTLTEKYRDLIDKIRANRDKIFAHTDRDYQKMLFSANHVSHLEKMYGAKYGELTANVQSNERYTATDLTKDIPQLIELLGSLSEIWQECLASDPQFEVK